MPFWTHTPKRMCITKIYLAFNVRIIKAFIEDLHSIGCGPEMMLPIIRRHTFYFISAFAFIFYSFIVTITPDVIAIVFSLRSVCLNSSVTTKLA